MIYLIELHENREKDSIKACMQLENVEFIGKINFHFQIFLLNLKRKNILISLIELYKNREKASINVCLQLKNVEVIGKIRFPFKFLV